MSVVQETRFEYKGYPCVVLFNSLGHRCGYVGLPHGTDVKINDINCHGGITYSSSHLVLQKDTDRFWIGFDTAHCFDKSDFEKAKEYFANDKGIIRSLQFAEAMNKKYKTGGEIRTLEYCVEECRKIVDQIEGGA